MSTLLHPVGPEPPNVYWRRRAIAVGAVVILIIVLVMIIKAMAGGGDKPSPSDSPSPSVSQSGSTDAAVPPPEVPDCEAKDIKLELAADAGSYPGAEEPSFTATVANIGLDACAFDPVEISLNVVSGSDQIYNSGDCGEGDPVDEDSDDPDLEDPTLDDPELDDAALDELTDAITNSEDPDSADSLEGLGDEDAFDDGLDTVGDLVLLQPGAEQPVPLDWNRARSNPTCDANLPAPRPGTYRATATLLGSTTEDAVFQLAQ
jgi:hypothetical protein